MPFDARSSWEFEVADVMMSNSRSISRIALADRKIYGLLAVLVIGSLQFGCQRAVRRFAGNAAGGVVDQVIAQPTSTVELLEAELRWMEDNLYQLDDELDAAILQLDSARRDNAVLRLELAEALGEKLGAKQSDSTAYDYSEEIDLSPPVVVDQKSVLRSSTTLADPDAQAESAYEGEFDPNISYGTPTLAPSDSGIDRSLEADANPATKAGSESNPIDNSGKEPTEGNTAGDTQTDTDAEDGGDGDSSDETGVRLEAMPEPKFTPPAEPVELPKPDPFNSRFNSYDSELRSVKSIKLNRKLTGGYDFDRQPGHEGVMVVIEPQNKKSEYVPVTGAVTVEVQDLAKSGLSGRVGKWKFDPIEAREHLKKTAFGKGVHLELPWPGPPPENRDLEVRVQLQLADGRTLSTKMKILVEPPTSVLMSKANSAAQRWSPTRPSPTKTRSSGYPSASRPSSQLWFPNR